MSLIRLDQISLAFGEAPLLDKINLQIEPKERIFLIGRNGMGKSCLLKVIMGHIKPDDGKIFKNPGLIIAELAQELPNCADETVYNVVADGLQEMGILLKKYHELILHTPDFDNENIYNRWLKELEETQKQIETKQGWGYQNSIDNILTQLELPADQKMGKLSGGWQRRVALARALVANPDILLLDEPTNHLDLDIIQWLEDYLENNFMGSLVCITHDRELLKKLSSRILELDRGKLTSFIGSYDKYLLDRKHRLEVEETQAKLFDKNLAKEEAWIRQGIKARRTRNEGRVRALYKLRKERQERRVLQGKPSFSAGHAPSSGDLVIKALNISYSYSKPNNDIITLVNDFSINIFKGDKIALVGLNGVGKTTLLRLLLGELKPKTGRVELGTNLHIAYFDQLRNSINPELSAIENVAGGRESITINGQEKHIISYLSDYLFSPDRVRMPVKLLSGGECNRLLLAKMFSLPNNLLVLDEPTNDLDIESLELLEDILVQYQGTILIVSHDRAFIDEVAMSTLYFSGQGKITEFVGGYKDIPKEYLEMFEKKVEGKKVEDKKIVVPAVNAKSPSPNLTSKIKRELAEIERKIPKLEKELSELQIEIAEPSFYMGDKNNIKSKVNRLEKIEQELRQLYSRWEELDQG